MNTIKPDYSYADPKSKFVWVKRGKKTVLEKRVISTDIMEEEER